MNFATFREKGDSYFKVYANIAAILVLLVFLLAQFIIYRKIVSEDLLHDAELHSKLMAAFVLGYVNTGKSPGFWSEEFRQKLNENLFLLKEEDSNSVSLKVHVFDPQTSGWREVFSADGGFVTSISPAEKRVITFIDLFTKGSGRVRYNGEGFVVTGTTEMDVNNVTKLKVTTDVEANDFIRQQLWAAIVLILLFGVIVLVSVLQYRLLFFTLYKPLDNLIEGMKVISQGNLDYRIPVLRQDKLGSFIESFNNMVEELKKSRQDLEKELSITKKQREKIFEVYRDVIFAVTQGKLLLVKVEELPSYTGEGQRLAEVTISRGEDVGLARKVSKQVVRQLFPRYQKTQRLLLCVSEAATNVVKHAGFGVFSILKTNDTTIRFIFQDKGPGIDLDYLPSALFYQGFSTKASLGYGFTLIYNFVDKIILSSTKNGTTLAFDIIFLEQHENNEMVS